MTASAYDHAYVVPTTVDPWGTAVPSCLAQATDLPGQSWCSHLFTRQQSGILTWLNGEGEILIPLCICKVAGGGDGSLLRVRAPREQTTAPAWAQWHTELL